MEILSKLKSLGIEELRRSDKNFCDVVTFSSLKPGMGITMGNAIRRTLLANMPGYAIKSIKILGVQHEFTTIPGLKEDVVELVANLRKVVFKGEVSIANVTLEASTNTNFLEIHASDINSGPLEIVNPEVYIGSIASGFQLKLEMVIEKGFGVKLINATKKHDNEIGAIVCDQFFSPISNVNFTVSSELDLEAVEITIQTNGSITPAAAFEQSFNLLTEQLMRNNFSNNLAKAKESKEEAIAEKSISNKRAPLNPNLFLKIEELPDMSTRIIRCLKMLDITYIGDLVKISRETLMKEPNFGENSLHKLNEKLDAMGLSLEMTDIEWPPKNLDSKEKEISRNAIL